MAFNLSDRFPSTEKYYRLLDPCAYDNDFKPKATLKLNKAPFLSKASRNTQSSAKIWTHTLYYADYPSKIPNCTSFNSKKSRFPYEPYRPEDFDEILCKCGIIEETCECAIVEEKPLCQAKVKKRLYKGHPPRSAYGKGLSSPSETDRGFHLSINGKIRNKTIDASPPFYDTNVHEYTAFYQGCKWSKWTSLRTIKNVDTNPGPTHYTLLKKPTKEDICLEKLRSYKRQTSKQLRFIEAVQQRNILDGLPGPANYSPLLQKRTELKYLGSKAERFPNQSNEKQPGPADYWLRRDFDPIRFEYSCHAKLPEPSCFGIKALRFRSRIEEGASPASYYPGYNPCNILICSKAPFGTSAQRFKNVQIEESDEEGEIEIKTSLKDENIDSKSSVLPSWEFRSKTIRMQKLCKKLDEPSPADLPQSRTVFKRSQELQYVTPFFSSERRFNPWYNWIPVYGKLQTPGPCRYSPEKSKCYPAVYRGPLFRAGRFLPCHSKTPAPNEYSVKGGIETILKTHNERLKYNISHQYKFTKESPKEQRKLSPEEKEILLIDKSIALLETENSEVKNTEVCSNNKSQLFDQKKKPKLLRSFLYNQQISALF